MDSTVLKAVEQMGTHINTRLDAQDNRIKNLDNAITEIVQGRDVMPGFGRPQAKSWADTFMRSDALAALRDRQAKSASVPLDLSLKALLDNEGASTQAERDPRIAGFAARRLSVFEVLPTIRVSSNAFEFNRLDNYTNLAAQQVTEGAGKQETAMPLQLVSVPIVTIAHHLPVSRQAVADNDALRQQVETVLRYGVLSKAASEIIAGNSSTGISGLEAEATSHNMTASTNLADGIGDAAATLDAAGWRADLVLMHPGDWQAIRAERSATEDLYVAGGWSAAPGSIWGMQVATDPAVSQGSPIVLDSSQVAILDRQQATVEIGYTGTGFTDNVQTILSEVRLGFAVFSPSAVLQIFVASD